MESDVLDSPTYQNFPGAGAPKRRPPPPPPAATASPDAPTPPALPPRNCPPRDNSQDTERTEDEVKVNVKSRVHQWESNSPREEAYAAQLRRQAAKISSQRAIPSSMSFVHTHMQTNFSVSYKQTPTIPQEATTPTSSAAASPTSSISSRGAGASSAHRYFGSDVSSAADSPSFLSPSRQAKDSTIQHAAAAYMDTNSRPPLPPEQTVLHSRENSYSATRIDNFPPRDRSRSEIYNRGSDASYLSSPDHPRCRSSSDTNLSKAVETGRDRSCSPGKPKELPMASSLRRDNPGVDVDPPIELPPPPSELLNGQNEEKDDDDPFADNSYGAYRNRRNRQVGTYKRSVSAATIQPVQQQATGNVAAGANQLPDNSRLGMHNWNSDSQLQQSTSQLQQGTSQQQQTGDGGPAGQVPSFKVDSGPLPARMKMSSVAQPLAGYSDIAGDHRGSKLHVQDQMVVPDEDTAKSAVSSPKRQSVKDRVSTLERKSSLSSCTSAPAASTSPVHATNSSSSNWASAAVFDATQHARGENSENHVSSNHPVARTDLYQPTEPYPAQSHAHSKQSDMFNVSALRYSQRQTEVISAESDIRSSPSSMDYLPSSSSPYNRRESAPASDAPPKTTNQKMPSRRQSEGIYARKAEQELQPSASHGRQPSQEELECDWRAKELAREVADSEKKLSDVLSTDTTKQRMAYMDGLFPRQPGPSSPTQDDQANKKNSLPKAYFVSPPKAMLEMEWRKREAATDWADEHNKEALVKQKEELIVKLYKKLDLLKEERKGLQEEIKENNALGIKVCQAVDSKCQNPSERDKFHTYIEDLEKIVRLLLNLSGQLARAENAVQGLADNADPKLKEMTTDKRHRLQVKHSEAKQLKEDIDRRSNNVSTFLQQSLSVQELNDYAYFVKMKSKLTIELQELEDKITLGQEQIQELKKSIPEHVIPPISETLSSAASSPSASPAPSS